MIDLSYWSHIGPLAVAVTRTTGAVLECGVGAYSTPLLHVLCKGRNLTSVETDGEWLGRFVELQTIEHNLLEVPDVVAYCQSIDYPVGLAFVDSSPGEDRGRVVNALKDKARFIVCHDTENLPVQNFGYEPVFAGFKYRADYKVFMPWTTIVSNFERFEI